MKCEINKDFYCSAGLYKDGDCEVALNGCYTCKKDCQNYHRKHPTPEQFKKEYLIRKLPKDFPVWFFIQDVPSRIRFTNNSWTLMVYEDALKNEQASKEANYTPVCYIVCACTPWGRPPDDWRPE